ncbi:MAG: M28 family peptidase [Planctomycetes bacterium]|nr:M28 family peptidase [Planctomycetota bacterium]
MIRSFAPTPFLVLAATATAVGGGFDAGLATIRKEDLSAHLRVLAGPEREGRDTPSQGQAEAARFLEQCYRDAGWLPAPDSVEVWKALSKRPLPPLPESTVATAGSTAPEGTYLRPYTRRLPRPDSAACYLRLDLGAGAPKEFVLGTDFVPLARCEGEVKGELAFAGFAIEAKKESYDDLEGVRLKGRVALVFEGEPDHPKRFDGPELTPDASLWKKVEALRAAQVAGVLFVRRPLAADPKSKDADTWDEPGLSFRSTWAEWNQERPDERPKETLPCLEISMDCASALAGVDLAALERGMDKSARPNKQNWKGRAVLLRSRCEEAEVELDNVVAWLPGSDEKLAEEVVVIGAHYDHIGVDTRGRVGFGADDNASGSAGLIEIAQTLAAARPRRSILACSFSGEEDGLLGSKALAQRLPVDKARIVAMLNMDMIGRGDKDEVAVLGIVQNPALEKVIERAKRLAPSLVQKIVMRQGEDLFERSDHFSFHEIGLPVLFFFEGLPIERNPDYHTWRDTLDKLDVEKMRRTSVLVYETAWTLANDDNRPPRSRE